MNRLANQLARATSTLALSTLSLSTLALSTLVWQNPSRADNPDHMRQLLNTGACVQCDLTRAGLVLADLEGSDLQEADLFRANLSRASLVGSNLSGANLSGATLYGANLMGVDLSGANLTGADLRGAYMLGAILDGTRLDFANLQGAIALPSNAGAFEDFHNWGVAAAKMGNHEDALGYYNQALERNPEFALTYISRAISHRNLNDPEAAIVDSKKAAELFKTQGNEQGVEFAEGLVLALEQSMQPPSQRGDLLMAWLT